MLKGKIYAAADHGGFELKEILVKHLQENHKEFKVIECDGASSATDPVDYPDVAANLAKKVLHDELSNSSKVFGLLVCGSGIGISIAANKVEGARCALVHDGYTASMARRHNDANIVAFGGRVVGSEVAKDALTRFVIEDFEGGRHEKRVQKIRSNELYR